MTQHPQDKQIQDLKLKPATIKEKFSYYRRYFFLITAVLGFVLGIIGSYEIYAPQFTNPIKLWSTIAYSVVKLFLFVPTEGITKIHPLSYEIAIWLAPLSTVLGFFSIFGKAIRNIRLLLRHRTGDGVLVLGSNANAIRFVKNLIEDDPKSKVRLAILPGSVIQERELLEKTGVMFFEVDYTAGVTYANRRILMDSRIDQAKRIISFLEEPTSFSAMELLHACLPDDAVTEVFLSYEDESLKELVQPRLDALTNLDIRYFNILDITAMELLGGDAFKITSYDQFEEPWTHAPQTFSEISDALGHAHVLLIGFDGLGEKFLHQLGILGTVNTDQKLHVSVVDRQAEKKFALFEGRVDQIHKVADVDVKQGELQYLATKRWIKEQDEEDPITHVIFTLKDPKESLVIASDLERYMHDTPIAVYAPERGDTHALVMALEERGLDITLFGTLSDVLDADMIFQETRLQQAKAFNKAYGQIQSEIMGWDVDERGAEAQWNDLKETIKKESNIAQAAHAKTKRRILEKFGDVESRTSQWKDTVMGIEGVPKKVEWIEEDALRNYMAALEHRRWCNFYYLKGWRYSQVRDDKRKRHDCLIDDWEVFMDPKTTRGGDPNRLTRDTAIYDFFASLNV